MANFLEDLLRGAANTASRAYDQVNPLDGGKNWNQRTATPAKKAAPKKQEPRLSPAAQQRVDANTRRNQQMQANIYNPLEMLKDVATLAGQAGQLGKDLTVGTVEGIGNRVADFGEAGANVVREFSGQNAAQERERQAYAAQDKKDLASLQNLYQKTADPAKQKQILDTYNRIATKSADVQANYGQMEQQALAALDPRKTLTNAAETVLDVATAGRGSALLQGLKPAGTQVTKEVAKQLAKNAGKTTLEGAGLGAAYGGINTAKDANATLEDYKRNITQGAVIGGGVGLGAQVALPVAGQLAKNGAKTTVKAAQATQHQLQRANRKQQESLYRAAAQDKILQRVEPHYIQPSGKQLDQGIVSQHRAEIINGNIDPIIVTQNADGTMKILDGEHRYQAYLELGVPQVPTRVVTPAEVRMMKQGGYVKLPDNASDDLAKKVFTKGTDANALYHGTEADKAISILKDGKLKAHAQDSEGKFPSELKTASDQSPFVSFSRQRNAGFYNTPYTGVRFVADSDKVKSKLGKTEAYVDGEIKPEKYDAFEAEQRIGKDVGLENIRRIEINTKSGMSPDEEQLIRQLAKEKGIPVVDVDNAKDVRSVLQPASAAPKSQLPTPTPKQPVQKLSKRVKQAEDDFIAGKIDANRLEAVREADAKGVPLPKKVLPARNLDTKSYVKEQTKAQKAASKSGFDLSGKTSDFKEKFMDDLAPIEDRLNKAIKQGTSVDPKDHITYQLDRSRRAEGVMNAYVRDNGLDKVIQNVKNTNEFDQYLIARHAKELDESISTGRDAAKDAALVKQLDGQYGAAAKELYKYNQKLLDSSVEYGLISKATADSLKKQYPEYVPFNRIFNEDELTALSGGNGSGNASIGKQTVVQKLKGSKRAIASPLNSIIDKTRLVVEQGERNKAAQILASYKDIEGNPFNLKEIGPSETIGSRHTISYLDNGKKRTFETDKEISEAAKNMTREEIGLWGRIAAMPARALRGGATTLNVGFAGANVVKDVMGAAINSRHVFRIADPQVMGKALAAALHHNGKYYHELMREGVAGTSFDMYRDPLKSNVKELRSHKNIGTRAAYNVTHPGQWLRTFENTIGRSEDFGRALQYYSNKKGYKGDGKNNLDATILAADQARSNSTNFFRHGSVGKNINVAIPYWNAGVQGARIMAKRTKERPVQTIAKLGFVIAAPSAMIAMNNYGDEKKREVMANIPDYEKEGNIIIVGDDATYNAKTNKWEGVTKIPVPPQHMGVHMSIQDAIKSAFTGEAMNPAKNVGRIIEDYTTINPLQPSETLTRHIPQAAKLIAEPMTNTNMYTGNRIVPESQKNLPAPDQYNEYTSGTAKVLGKTFNASPRMIDNSIRTGLGGAGQNVVNMTDSALAATGLIKKEEVQGKNIADSVKGRFSGANAISPADRAEKKLEDFKKQVTSTDAYKNASQYDKGRMLNRLESDVNAVEWDKAPAKDGKEKDKLTKKQQTLATDGFKVDTYTDLSEKKGSSTEVAPTLAKNYKDTIKEFDGLSEDERKKKIYKENDAEFRLAAAQYENDKANGTLTPAKRIEAEDKLVSLQVGSKFPKDVRDLYGLTKTQLTTLVDKGEVKESQAEQILAMDDAMVAAGKKRQWRDKNGNVAIRPKGKSSGGGRKKGTGGKGGTKKGQIPKSDDNSSTISLVANLSRKAANTKVAKRAIPKGGNVRAPGIKAYKKVAKTNVSMTRKA